MELLNMMKIQDNHRNDTYHSVDQSETNHDIIGTDYQSIKFNLQKKPVEQADRVKGFPVLLFNLSADRFYRLYWK